MDTLNDEDDNPNNAYQDEYVLPLGEAIVYSPYFPTNKAGQNNDENDNPVSPEFGDYISAPSEEEDNEEDILVPATSEDSQYILAPSRDKDDEDDIHIPETRAGSPQIPPMITQTPEENSLEVPPFPRRVPRRRTANQLPDSDSEEDEDVEVTPKCENIQCRTPKAANKGNRGPNGKHLCINCYRRYRQNPFGNWQEGQIQVGKGATCENAQCRTPQAHKVGRRGPNEMSLCENCYGRYKRNPSGNWQESRMRIAKGATCENPLCRTPKSHMQAKQGPDGMQLCYACYMRYIRNPTGDWQQGQHKITTACENELCSTPKSTVTAGQIGPNGELLCLACHQRYKRLLGTKSTVPRGPDSWKSSTGARARKGMQRGKRKEDETVESLVTSSSESDKPIRGKRDESHRSLRLKARVPEKNKCQSCFDYGMNCDKRDDEKCSNCKRVKRLCKPLQLNPDGSLPERRFSKTIVRHEDELKLEERCYQCQKRHRKCDAKLPIDPKNPCTACRKHNSFCCSLEQVQQMKDNPPCLRCGNKSSGRNCDRGQPCGRCVKDSHPRCTYNTKDKTRWITTLTNPIPPNERTSKQDANADYYDPTDRPGCSLCQKYYKFNKQRAVCTFEQGGPPCIQCLNRQAENTNRCTNWVAPGKVEAVVTDMYKVDNDGNVVLDLAKSNKSTRKRKYRTNITEDNMSTSQSSSESEHEGKRQNVYSEESRALTREKLMNIQLPEAFIAAMSLTALSTPIDNALRPDPQSYSEAMKSPDARMWRNAIQVEYDSLIENRTWKVVDLPPGRKALTTKWVLKKKLGPGGEVVKYKARMVARGFQQVEGYDYTETYSGVVKAASYRLLFALVTLNGWTCHQMDVVTAFLNGDVFKEIYIHPPQGYPHPGKVLRLLKALYGLKQSPRLWYRKLRQWLVQNDWQISKYDECVFYNYNQQLIITVYVDDINIFGLSDQHITPFKKDIAQAFKMTDAGRASWYLGMQLDWVPEGLHIHQSGFIQQALGKYGLLGSRPASIPLDPTRKLLKETEHTADPKYKTTYMSMVGSLNYLQTKTVWAMAFPVSLVSRFMTNPNETHMDAVLQEFRYLAGSPERGLLFQKDGDSTLRGFVDSDWGGDTDTGKSTTGWVFTLANCPVSWASQRQKTVSSSSTEAEYIAASDACKEAIWLKGFHNEMVPIMNTRQQETIPLAIDNASALKLTKNPEFHGRTKHINIRHHFIRECVERGEVIPEWISGKANPADLFTKALPKTVFLENIQKLGGGMPASSTSRASKTSDENIA